MKANVLQEKQSNDAFEVHPVLNQRSFWHRGQAENFCNRNENGHAVESLVEEIQNEADEATDFGNC